MGEPDEAARMFALHLFHVVIDGAADGKIGLVEADHAGEHRRIDPGMVHHPHMGIDVAEQRVQQMHRIAALVDADGDRVGLSL